MTDQPDAAWYRALPADARVQFEAELAAATSADRPATLAAWKLTGDVYADPELLATLSTDSVDDEAEPNPRIQAAVAKLRAERTPTPERDGYTIAVYLPPGVSASVRAYLSQAIADLAHTADWHQGWDAHVVGQAGDPLGAVDGTVRP